jgi:hypothetical protein
MDTAKLSIKLGALEVVYEGHQTFIESGLMDIVERLASMEIQDVVPTSNNSQGAHAEGADGTNTATPNATTRLSTTDFAVKMSAKSGSDLVMAAAAYLHHTRGSEDFRRSDLLTAMRGAKAFYKTSYGSNLSKSLEMLTKSGRLQNPGSETYALPYSEIEATKRLLQ